MNLLFESCDFFGIWGLGFGIWDLSSCANKLPIGYKFGYTFFFCPAFSLTAFAQKNSQSSTHNYPYIAAKHLSDFCCISMTISLLFIVSSQNSF
jgi:hypothetical protein